MTLNITTAPCTNVLSAFQWKTSAGTGLRLRIDSRTALTAASFKVPRQMLPKLKDAGKHAIGQARLFLAGGAKVPFNLILSKGDKTATLLLPASNSPRIQLTKSGLVVSGLPAKVGILEVTLFTLDKTSPNALLSPRKKARLSATVTVNRKLVRLTTIIVAQRH
jgi:hypothetical protein